MNKRNLIKLLSTTIVCCFSINSFSFCDQLYGKWQSSKELSMAYNYKSKSLTNQQIQLLEQILGHLTVVISPKVSHQLASENITVKVDDKETNFNFDEQFYNYDIVSCTPKKVKIKYLPIDSKPTVRQLNFVNKNTYWFSSPFLPNSREYFIRLDDKY